MGNGIQFNKTPGSRKPGCGIVLTKYMKDKQGEMGTISPLVEKMLLSEEGIFLKYQVYGANAQVGPNIDFL
jgi:hypothetical protein